MKILSALVSFVSMIVLAQTASVPGAAAPPVAKAPAPMPAIRTNGAVKIMEGKPFIMLSGELHNASASSVE
jgi:hypothetical protein